MSRRGRGGLARLESPPPINRYAGDWSVCGRELLSGHDADYDEVAGSDSDAGKCVCFFFFYFIDLTLIWFTQLPHHVHCLHFIYYCLSIFIFTFILSLL